MKPEDVLEFWFDGIDRTTALPPDGVMGFWFGGDAAVDSEIRKRFDEAVHEAHEGGFSSWEQESRSRLALIVLIDQFSRNVFRDDPRAYAADDRAQKLCLEGIGKGHDRDLHPLERLFFYMPLEHAEDSALQAQCVDLMKSIRDDVPDEEKQAYDGLVDYAVRHQRVVDRFGRFPHRNEVLGRESTPEEIEFLASDAAPF